MNRIGGVTAACDHDGCGAQLVVYKGDDPTWVLEWAGWFIVASDGLTFCPDHSDQAKMVVNG